MRRLRGSQGLTVVEALVAITILGIVTAAVMTAYVSSIRNNANAGQRTQSAQVLNFLGRRVAGGDNAVLADKTAKEWGYGDLLTAFPELDQEDGFANPDLYRASVTNLGAITLAGASAVHYHVEVCARPPGGGGESCVAGDTTGPVPNTASATPAPLPGIN